MQIARAALIKSTAEHFVFAVIFCIVASTQISCDFATKTSRADNYQSGINEVLDFSAMPRLRSLSILPLALNQPFSKNVLHYTVENPSTIIPVLVHADVEKGYEEQYQVRYLPGKEFASKAGLVVEITVLDKNSGQKTSYYITFKDNELPPATLANIILSTGSLVEPVAAGKNEYAAEVPFGVDNVIVFPIGGQSNSYFMYNDADNPIVRLSDGEGSMKIAVTAQNHKPFNYVISFRTQNPSLTTQSRLRGIALTAGSLDTPFSANVKDGRTQTIRIGTEEAELTVSAIKQYWTDTVYFDGEKNAPSDVKTFTNIRPGMEFTITVDGGPLQSEKTYRFVVVTGSEQSAALQKLNFHGINVFSSVDSRVYRRNTEDGGRDDEGFSPGYSLYNLAFQTLGESAIIEALPEEGSEMSVDKADDVTVDDSSGMVTIRVTNLSASREPVEIRVTKTGYMPKTYYVFFSRIYPIPAILSTINISAAIGDGEPSFDDLSDTSPRFVKISDTAHLVVVRAESNPIFNIAYKPHDGVMSGVSLEGRTMEITVSGGPDYHDSTYTLNFTTDKIKPPRLSALKINRDAENIAGFSDTRLVYDYTITQTYGQGTLEIPVAWAINDTNVDGVFYSLNYGAEGSWQKSTKGFISGITLAPAQTALVLIKVTGRQDTEALYFITINRPGL
jgi:hypothetical protein